MSDYVAELEARIAELERQVSLNTIQEAADLLAERFEWVAEHVGKWLPPGNVFKVRKVPLFQNGLEVVLYHSKFCEVIYKLPWSSCVDEVTLREAIENGEKYVIHMQTAED